MSAHRSRLLFVALTAAALTPEVLAAAPRYKMVLDASQAEHGVKTVSLVKNPAIERGWVALSAAEPTAAKRFHLSEATEGPARQVLTGPALIPGQEILRVEQGTPFYITFDAATIEGTARLFAAQGHHNSTNQDHATALAGNVVYESWIVTDPANDKAAALGLDVPAGTWMLSVHIPDADYWQNEVVTGNKLGFSIEGFFSTEQLTLSAAQPTKLSSVKNWFKNWTAKLSAEKAKELAVTLGVVQLTDGRAVSIDEATGVVTVANADGTPGEALPDGEYDIEGGGKLVVKGGVKAADAPAPVENAADDKQPTDQPAAPAPLAPEASTADIVAAVNELMKLVSGGKTPDPATTPAGEKLAAALHKVALADLGPKLASLKLDAIDLEGGGKLIYNAVTRQLRDEKGALAESGYYAAADGSYFNVSTDQYIYEISKPTYDSVYLQRVELADAKLKLAQQPAGKKVLLHGEEATEEPKKTRLQLAREVAGA